MKTPLVIDLEDALTHKSVVEEWMTSANASRTNVGTLHLSVPDTATGEADISIRDAQ